MSDQYYKCDRCGSVFTADDIIYKRSPDGNPYEDQYLCPNCHYNSMTKGYVCEYCGDFYPEDEEYFDGCCYECGSDAEEAMKAYFRHGKEMTDKQRKIMDDYWGCL